MKTSPTQLTLRLLRSRGYTCWVAEHWNSYTSQRKDLFNFIDIVALGDNEIIGVQCTSWKGMSARRKKLRENEYVPIWNKSGGLVKLIGWEKVGSRYRVKEEDI